MYVVVHRILQGQDGNQGVEFRYIGEFDTEEEAKQWIEEHKVNNGWHSYTVAHQERM